MELNREVFVVAGLGYGDEGKGSVVDYLVRAKGARAVVRYNGGPQAGHNVVLPDGRQHTFSQFGSGSFVPGVSTFLSRYMLVNPLGMLAEERHLQAVGVADAFARTYIDARCPVVTPFHRAANRLLETARGSGRHGSCGMGVGQTMRDYVSLGGQVLTVGDLRDPVLARQKLAIVQSRQRECVAGVEQALPGTPAVEAELAYLLDREAVHWCLEQYGDFLQQANIVDSGFLGELLASGPLVFEGAQGVLLDAVHGFFPYVTYANTTFQNAFDLLAEQGCGSAVTVGVLRAYATRHGAGPFVTEDAALSAQLVDAHNTTDQWQGGFRAGWFDAVAARYALAVVGGVDSLVLTHADRVQALDRTLVCTGYDLPGNLPGQEQFFIPEPAGGAGLRAASSPGLERQQELTRLLGLAAPRYTALEQLHAAGGIHAYLALLEQCGVTADIVSLGPTHADKVFKNTLAPDTLAQGFLFI